MSNQQIGEVQQVPQAQSQPAQPQHAGVMSPVSAPYDMSRKIAKQRKVLSGLGISVIILGSICFVLGIVVTGSVNKYNNSLHSGNYSLHYQYEGPLISYDPDDYSFHLNPKKYSTGYEGLWGGLLFIIAGIHGVAAGRPKASQYRMKTHMAFSIIGAVIAGIMAIMGIAYAEVTNISLGNPAITGLQLTSGVLSFILMILEIFSASYCCTLISCCGGYTRKPQPQLQGYRQVASQVTYAQQPVMVQGMPANVNPGQAYYPNTTIYQQTLPVAVAQPSQVPANIYQQPQHFQYAKERKYFRNAPGSRAGPPSYERFK